MPIFRRAICGTGRNSRRKRRGGTSWSTWPARWSDSVASLQTAVAILITYTPAALKDGDAYQQAIGALRRRILRDSRRAYEARHGTLSLKPRRK